MIDFEWDVEEYNKRHGTDYTVHAFLTMAYKKHGNIARTAEWLGYCDKTLRKYMRQYGVEVRKVRGGRQSHEKRAELEAKLNAIPDEVLREMTRFEVMRKYDCSEHYFREITRGREYKKNYHPAPKKDAFLAIPAEQKKQMSAHQIRRETGMSREYVYFLARKHEMDYRPVVVGG